ncbi:MAG: hypothetical protein GY940_32785 [bacterium]|nr:hypothetical protein [bacterium]
MANDNNQKAPDISIDEALNLFLAVTYPNGIPEGVDKEQLMDALRKQITKDRPQWTEADERNTPPSSRASAPDGKSYAQVKETVIQEAQREDIPDDPEERYLYERRKEARQNREQKEADQREHQIREDLRSRLSSRKKEEGKETLEKAVLIRRVLEQRMQKVLQTQPPPEKEKPSRLKVKLDMPPAGIAMDGLAPLKNQPTPESIDVTVSPGNELVPDSPSWEAPTGKESAGEFFNAIKDLDPDEKVRSFREFNQVRRGNLQTREDVLSSRSRRPSRFDERMSMDMEGNKEKDNSMELSIENIR